MGTALPLPMFNPMMTGFCVLTIAILNPRPLGFLSHLEECLHPLVEVALIPFERQDLVSPLIDDLGCDITLSPHRIQSDNRTLNIQ